MKLQLQFLYKGYRLPQILSFGTEEITNEKLIGHQLEDIFSKGTDLIEYEIGLYSNSDSIGPVSGATSEETKRVISFIAQFYEMYRISPDKIFFDQEKLFNLASDRLRRIMLLLTDHLGMKMLFNIWLNLMATRVTGLKKKEIREVLGK